METVIIKFDLPKILELFGCRNYMCTKPYLVNVTDQIIDGDVNKECGIGTITIKWGESR